MINEPTSGVVQDQEDQGNQEERYVIFVVLGRVVFLCCLVTKQVFFDSFLQIAENFVCEGRSLLPEGVHV